METKNSLKEMKENIDNARNSIWVKIFEIQNDIKNSIMKEIQKKADDIDLKKMNLRFYEVIDRLRELEQFKIMSELNKNQLDQIINHHKLKVTISSIFIYLVGYY